ncbi:Zn-dependent peptidase ImmA, M78 family [Alicyclobacillus hesperidum]|uniref:Zn-dependent peptidase ImmA, M78 family n=1 Tax=Alicyclobacillus hesperidum TaxID=89784 RepID=A0A1H2YGS9_9BACL|nr:ImmA/IrrE family metallo-endopeptidase [Alicyclobacillus hesperidum]SDX03759.1 Zn-dependent peptidase ImmA, M78 family [Alicyclobacillus hesperidum]
MDIPALIQNLYLSHGICRPEHIDLDYTAAKLGFEVHYIPRRSCCLKLAGKYELIVDKRQNRSVQRVHLAHEMGHAILHTGDQTEIVMWGRLRQEYQARNFAFEALAPSFMLQSISVLSESLSSLSERFNVPVEWMYERLSSCPVAVAEEKSEFVAL